ncbi:alpha/beta hydrolase [Micromonospora acroterricola]|uniref:Alpha/beta hydrolase n=1 Tax=Micromonospora acroterricola TaxID=2202421 RepID=A0A317D0J5_9ACTN|nr:alpha/beta hydrolase [Micromonospora acroterricola]PWR08391.1 alpha/beta hydrolase [Micromonospora acroterricola]
MGAGRLIAVLVTALLAGCAPASAVADGSTAAPDGPPSARRAPEGSYTVGVRTLTLDPRSARPLPVTIWYPASAAGRFPVVIYSHGLDSRPELHAGLTARWAAAGFVVAAPAFPHTRRGATGFTRADVRNQPADCWRLVRHLRRLDADPADPLAGHLDLTSIAAAGHSAGGFTTAGMFTEGHPARLRAGIVIAGGGLPGSFAGPAARLLFVHGTADPVVPVAVGRAAYRRTPGPAAFLSLLGQDHGAYLTPGHPGFGPVLTTTTDFLRRALYDDQAAGARLPADAGTPTLTRYESRPAR